jgi:hypothetical protein
VSFDSSECLFSENGWCGGVTGAHHAELTSYFLEMDMYHHILVHLTVPRGLGVLKGKDFGSFLPFYRKYPLFFPHTSISFDIKDSIWCHLKSLDVYFLKIYGVVG